MTGLSSMTCAQQLSGFPHPGSQEPTLPRESGQATCVGLILFRKNKQTARKEDRESNRGQLITVFAPLNLF